MPLKPINVQQRLGKVKKDPLLAVTLCVRSFKKRWPEMEETISEHPKAASYYAFHILKSRWIKAEPVIIDSQYCSMYSMLMEDLRIERLRNKILCHSSQSKQSVD